MFRILLENEPVGRIALSHIDSAACTARVGYWLSDKHWGKGFMTLAFREVLLSDERSPG